VHRLGAELSRVESVGLLSSVYTTSAAIVFSDRWSHKIKEGWETPQPALEALVETSWTVVEG
jgi:hypothetical protein